MQEETLVSPQVVEGSSACFGVHSYHHMVLVKPFPPYEVLTRIQGAEQSH